MRRSVCAALALALLTAGGPAGAEFLAGEGDGATECWVGLSIDGVKPVTTVRGGRRPRIVQEACNGACVFSAQVCLNNPGCNPVPLTDVHALGPFVLDPPKAATAVHACGRAMTMIVPLRHGRRGARRKLALLARNRGPGGGRDLDIITVGCQPDPSGEACVRCGDGETDPSEMCDDANRNDGDGCDHNCTPTACGNGVRTPQTGEQCDDGDTVDGDGCDRNCTPTGCGNGVVTAGEDCDPPGPVSESVVCSPSCEREAIGPCTCPSPPTRLVLATRPAASSCGDALDVSGQSTRSLDCGGLYIGGGDATVQQPIPIPAGVETAFGVTCSVNQFTLGQTTPENAGGPNRCTAAGCHFGPPLAAPNTLSAQFSACIVSTLSRAAGGKAECDTGRVQAKVPLTAAVYLTGEDQAPGEPGLQACPVCIDGRCRGGANPGGTCTAYAPGILTSFDCLPAGRQLVDEVPLELSLSTDTVTFTAAPSGTQARVFCGFCRDADATLEFADPPISCRSPTSIAACAGQYESCEQRQQGAFGPNGGGVATIKLQGAAAGPLAAGTGADATLASVFCVPPVADDLVNNNVSLPGPAALTLPVRITAE
jgi:cysteine-rich repeat protein